MSGQMNPPPDRFEANFLTIVDGAMGKPLKTIYQGESHRKSRPDENTSRSAHERSKCSCHRVRQLLVFLALGSPVGVSCAPVPTPVFRLSTITSEEPSANDSRFVRIACACACDSGVGCESAIDPTAQCLANFVKE